ncbi:MAG: hypothetical protein VX694_12585 [Planctomycetota bacterium]|nr:hypothetical protein [Planctomycetota bacterium]
MGVLGVIAVMQVAAGNFLLGELFAEYQYKWFICVILEGNCRDLRDKKSTGVCQIQYPVSATLANLTRAYPLELDAVRQNER